MPDNRKTPPRGWNLTVIRARPALKLLPMDPTGSIDWSEVDIAQIDTGYTEHPVFGDFVAGETHLNIHAGRNFRDGETLNDPRDPINYSGLGTLPGHGTHTGSLLCGNKIAGKFDGGVAPGLPLIPYRVANTGIIGWPAGTKRDRLHVAQAIMHAVDENDVDAINMSMGIPWLSPFGSRPLGNAVDYAYEHGVIICAAAGQVIDRVTYPGKFYRTIGCGGIDPDKTMWNNIDQGYSEFDLIHIDTWAPANHINRPTVTLDEEGKLQTDIYANNGSGTSYATAHVTAAAAMWLVYHREAIALLYGHKPWMRIEAFRQLLKQTAKTMSGDQRPYPGTGILDIKALLEAELPQPGGLNKEERLAANMWA
ncbi:MAG: S8/S53 family peptidase [Sedimenticola sp.]